MIQKEHYRKIKRIFRKNKRNVTYYYSNFLISACEMNDIDSHEKTGVMNVIEELDEKNGVNVILHTPGESISATEEIIGYLKSSFGEKYSSYCSTDIHVCWNNAFMH